MRNNLYTKNTIKIFINSVIICSAVILSTACRSSKRKTTIVPNKECTINFRGAKLQIPSQAVKTKTLITSEVISRVKPEMRKGVKIKGRVYHFSGYEGKHFNKPIKISLPYRKSNSANDNYYPAYWNGNNWVKVSYEIVGSTFVIESNHLSYWSVLMEYYDNKVSEKGKNYNKNYNSNLYKEGKSIYIDKTYDIPVTYSANFLETIRKFKRDINRRKIKDNYNDFKNNNWIFSEFESIPNIIGFNFITEGVKSGKNETLYFTAAPEFFDNTKYAQSAYTLQTGINKKRYSHILPFAKSGSDSYLILIVPKSGITINESDLKAYYYYPEEGWKEFNFIDYGLIDKLTWELAQQKYAVDKLAEVGKFFRRLERENRLSNVEYANLDYDLYIIPFSGFWLESIFEGNVLTAMSQIKRAHKATAIRFEVPFSFNLPGNFEIQVIYNPGLTINGFIPGNLSDMYYHIGIGSLNSQEFKINLENSNKVPYFSNIERDLYRMIELQNNKKWEASLKYTHPEVFNYFSRKDLINLLKQANSMGYEFKCNDFKINGIESMVTYKGRLYTLVKNRFKLEATIPEESAQFISQIKDQYNLLYGNDNVIFNNRNMTFYAVSTTPVFAISENNGRDWTFFNANAMTVNTGIIPDYVLKELGFY